MGESFYKFVKAVSGKWGWLVTGVIGGGVFALNLLGIDPTISRAIGAGVLVACLLAACFLVYHELRVASAAELAQARAQAKAAAHARPLRPKKWLNYHDRMALSELETNMESRHGHCDLGVIESEMLNGRTIGEIMNDNCSACGEPRNQEGDLL